MDPKHLFYDERHDTWCSYCGCNWSAGIEATRDHIPPRCFIDGPVEQGLQWPVVKVCRPCNSTLAGYENLLACVAAATPFGDGVSQSDKATKMMERSSKLKDRVHWIWDQWPGDHSKYDDVLRGVLKIARGHAAYWLNEPVLDEPDFAFAGAVSFVSEEYLKSFASFEDSMGVYPEIGSRAFFMTGESASQPGWIEIKKGQYEYLITWSPAVRVRVAMYCRYLLDVTWA